MDHLLLIYTTIGTGIAVVAVITFVMFRFRLDLKAFTKEWHDERKSFAMEWHDEIKAFTKEVQGWKEELRKMREERNKTNN